MKKYVLRLLCYAILALLLVSVGPVNTQALELGDEITIPSKIDLQIHNSCWEHDWFDQYHVRADGWFVVLSRVANLNGADKQGFNRVYVDIYNAEGVFQKEISFNAVEGDIVAVIKETAVEIYMPNRYLSYNLQLGEVTCHYTPDNYLEDSGLAELVRPSERQVGEWTYKAKGFPNMRHILTREKDGQVETILKFKGSSMSFPNIVPYIVCSGVTILVIYGGIAFLIIRWVKKKKAQN